MPLGIGIPQAIALLPGPLVWPWLRTWEGRGHRTALMLRAEPMTSGSWARLPSLWAKIGRGHGQTETKGSLRALRIRQGQRRWVERSGAWLTIPGSFRVLFSFAEFFTELHVASQHGKYSSPCSFPQTPVQNRPGAPEHCHRNSMYSDESSSPGALRRSCRLPRESFSMLKIINT